MLKGQIDIAVNSMERVCLRFTKSIIQAAVLKGGGIIMDILAFKKTTKNFYLKKSYNRLQAAYEEKAQLAEQIPKRIR